MDISNILNNTGVALEAQAFRSFGAAVNNQVSGLLGVPNRPETFIPQSPNDTARSAVIDSGEFDFDAITLEGSIGTTNYAQLLGSGIGGFDPKNGFMFKVEFEFHNDVNDMARQLLGVDLQSDIQRNLSFLVKSIDLPRFKFDYTEFNYYNFRTKMLRRVEHEELSFKIYDDAANNALSFMNTYLKLLAPVHRSSWSSGAGLEENGFNFGEENYNSSSSQRDVLGAGGNQKNILRKMVVKQYYLNRNKSTDMSIGEVILMNTFEFTNPRITGLELPNLSWDGSGEPQEIGCSVDFDALHMVQAGQALADVDPNATGAGSTSDVLATALSGLPQEFARFPGTNSAGGGGRRPTPFRDILARQVQRGVQEEVANAFYRSGMGGIAGGALANTISTISGTLGTNAARTLSLGGNSVPTGISLSRGQQILDSAIGGSFLGQTISRANPFTGPGGG